MNKEDQTKQDTISVKNNWLTAIPDILDDFRVVPRVIVILYGYIFYDVTTWFMNLPDPSNAQVAFVSTIVGVAGAFFGIYQKTGKRE